MTCYRGCRTKVESIVTANAEDLDPRLDLRNHSPSGMEWGYTGSGPAQLALAMLADHLKDDQRALELYQRFKFAVVAKLPRRAWTLSSEQIDEVLRSLLQSEGVLYER